MKTILTAGQFLTIILPSGAELNVEVTQDTASVTIEDNVLYAQDLLHGAWETTWPKVLLGMILAVMLIAAPAQAKSYNRYGRSNRNNGQTTQSRSKWENPPMWYGPMMSQYLYKQYNLPSVGYSSFNGDGGLIYRSGPAVFVNPFVKGR